MKKFAGYLIYLFDDSREKEDSVITICDKREPNKIQLEEVKFKGGFIYDDQPHLRLLNNPSIAYRDCEYSVRALNLATCQTVELPADIKVELVKLSISIEDPD